MKNILILGLLCVLSACTIHNTGDTGGSAKTTYTVDSVNPR